jgi:hypothetical protein
VPLDTDLRQWKLLRGRRLVILAATEQKEWHQTHGNHVFDVFDTIPLILLHYHKPILPT